MKEQNHSQLSTFHSQLNEVPAGYKQTEVGVIPEDWEVGSLDSFWNTTDCKHVTAKFIDNGYPLASIQEVQSRFVDLTNAKHTTYAFFKLLTDGGRRLESGDLLLSRNATVGEVAQVMDWHPEFAMGQDVCLLRRRKKEYSPVFLQELFSFSSIKKQLDDCMVGTTFKRVNVKQVKALVVQMPSVKEQTAIANALSDVDVLIAALEKLINKKSAIKTAAMQQLLTGKKRLPPFDQLNTGYKQTELGEIPGDWNVVELGDVLSICHGRDQKQIEVIDGAYPILATGGEIGRTNSFLYDKPSVLIGRKGTINKPRFIDSPFWTVDTLFYSEIKSKFDEKFVYYKFCLIDWMAYNEASGVPSLNASTIENVSQVFPVSKEEQTAIANVLSDMDKDLEALQHRLHKTQQIKQGMMQELLTGKTRLI